MSAKWMLRRGGKRSGFRFVAPDGRVVRERETLERIARIGIPPAWTDVHVAVNARAAIQAWGFDARGRKQYRYHPRAVERGELRKFYRVRQMARDLPAIRDALRRDFRRADFSRECVTAAVVRLIGAGFFRVGSERYTRENKTFGITTLRKSHVRVEGDALVFSYAGKRSIKQRQVVVDPEMVQFVRALQDAPGARLFRYLEERRWRDLTAREVNEYIQALTGFPYTAKDFRTWGGTLRAATVLADVGPAASEREANRNVVTAVRLVAAELGNTPAICRKSYVHPVVIERYMRDGATIATLLERSPSVRRASPPSPSAHTPEERALIAFLDQYFPERRRKPRAPAEGAERAA